MPLCLSARIYQKLHVQISRNFMHTLGPTRGLAPSSSKDSAILYVFPFVVDDVTFSHNGANGPES